MTLLAAISPHRIQMGQMTILAGLYLAVKCMARCTVEFGMNTGVVLQLGILLSMTGQARIGYIFRQFYLKGSMRVDMAPQAILQAKMHMLSFFMTLITTRYYLHIGGRMAAMAIQTDRGMSLALMGQSKDDIFMALPTITV